MSLDDKLLDEIAAKFSTKEGKDALSQAFAAYFSEDYSMGYWLRDEDGNYYQIVSSVPNMNLYTVAIINSQTNEILEWTSADEAAGDDCKDIARDLVNQVEMTYTIHLTRVKAPFGK